MAVFGAAFVADNAMEIFYIREKPVVPQPGDGAIKVPAPGQMQFEDAFKVDVTGHGVSAQRILKDLPSKEVISCQRRRVRPFYAKLARCHAYPVVIANVTNVVAEERNECYSYDMQGLCSRQQEHGSQCQEVRRQEGCY